MATAFAAVMMYRLSMRTQAVFTLLWTFRQRVTFRSERPSSCSQVPRFNVSDISQEEKFKSSWRALRPEWEQLQVPLSQKASKTSNTYHRPSRKHSILLTLPLSTEGPQRLRALTVAMRLSNQETPLFSPSLSTNSLKFALASLAYYIPRQFWTSNTHPSCQTCHNQLYHCTSFGHLEAHPGHFNHVRNSSIFEETIQLSKSSAVPPTSLA